MSRFSSVSKTNVNNFRNTNLNSTSLATPSSANYKFTHRVDDTHTHTLAHTSSRTNAHTSSPSTVRATSSLTGSLRIRRDSAPRAPASRTTAATRVSSISSIFRNIIFRRQKRVRTCQSVRFFFLFVPFAPILASEQQSVTESARGIHVYTGIDYVAVFRVAFLRARVPVPCRSCCTLP